MWLSSVFGATFDATGDSWRQVGGYGFGGRRHERRRPSAERRQYADRRDITPRVMPCTLTDFSAEVGNYYWPPPSGGGAGELSQRRRGAKECEENARFSMGVQAIVFGHLCVAMDKLG